MLLSGLTNLRGVTRDRKPNRENIMAKPEQTDANLSPAQETLRQLWEEHVRYEFSTRNTEDTLATMVEDAYVNHIPVLTGGVGRDELREIGRASCRERVFSSV